MGHETDIVHRETISSSTDVEKSDMTDGFSEYKESGHPVYPNAWGRYREMLKEPFAEFLGTALIIIFGTGVVCQVVLSGNTGVASGPKGDYLSINLSWAAGVAIAVWVTGGVSGAHLNPAITLSFAVFRGFPWKKVPVYIISQIFGGFIGAAVVYATYHNAIDIVEGGSGVRTLDTAGLFSTYALPYVSNVSAFFNEFLGTLILMMAVLAINDRKNTPPPGGLAPLALFIIIFGIGAALGLQTGYAINPARDLGPRLLTAAVGYGRQVFNFRSQYWLWCPILGPISGALFGTLVYDAFIFTGDESILNKPSRRAQDLHLQAPPEQRRNMPAGPGADEKV